MDHPLRPLPDHGGTALTGSESLIGRLKRDSIKLRGAPEHAQFVNLAEDAEKYRLDGDVTEALARTVASHANSIERNVDLLSLTKPAVWIEYPDAPRRAAWDQSMLAGAAAPVTVGALVCIQDEDKFIVMTAWDFEDGSVRHSYVATAVSATDLALPALKARTYLSRDPAESRSRIVEQVVPYMPPGLRKELEVLDEHDSEGRSEEEMANRTLQAKLDVVAEIPFVFAALLSMATPSVSLAREFREDPWTVSLSGPGNAPRAWKRPGFHRSGRKSDPNLSFLPPQRVIARA